MQLEFALGIQDTENHRPIETEKRIWGNGRAIDIYAEAIEEGFPNIGIELKCRTAAEDQMSLTDGFHSDIVKVSTRPVDDAFTPTYLYAMGLTTEFADVQIRYRNVTDPYTRRPIPIYYEEVVQGLYLIYILAVEHV